MAEIKLTGVRDQAYDNRAAFADSAQPYIFISSVA